MGTKRRQRFTKIPIISRVDHGCVQVLLRFQSHWNDTWYWPSVTRDDSAPSVAEFLDTVSAELGVARENTAWRNAQVRVHHFYQELIYGPTGEEAAYCIEIMELSALAGQMRTDREFVSWSGKRYRWISLHKVKARKTAEGSPVAPEVWTMFEEGCSSKSAAEGQA